MVLPDWLIVALPAATAPPVGKVFGAGGEAKTIDEATEAIKLTAAIDSACLLVLERAKILTRSDGAGKVCATQQEGVFTVLFKLKLESSQILKSNYLKPY